MFQDRTDAGIQLAEKLTFYKDQDVVVLAIPRGGLPLGAIVAKALNAPLDVALIKKIGHPYNKEYAIGAVSLESVITSDTVNIPKRYIEEETSHIRDLLTQRYEQYYKEGKPHDLKDKVVIIVDDGIATGNTLLATVELIHKQKPKSIVVAIPVAPPSSLKKLEDSPFVNEVICLETPYNFMAVGQFYEEFDAVSDQEAIKILQETNKDR
ncbi:MAG: phosphoribosyltransferase [Flavobacteriaceae bacterium]|nr:phosphoribosyltransferase [Flavobacteriaceae bacterium]